MTSKITATKLAKLGFAYDEDVTGRNPVWGDWNGTIDPIGKMSIGDECKGLVVWGSTRAAMDANALERAAEVAPFLRPCTDPHCDMHSSWSED